MYLAVTMDIPCVRHDQYWSHADNKLDLTKKKKKLTMDIPANIKKGPLGRSEKAMKRDLVLPR